MRSRLAYLLLATASACATSASNDIDLDGLPPYDQGTGGGDKSDDANCTDETYRAFMQEYLAGTQQADANPCVSGNDASYRIWAYVAGQELGKTLTAYTHLRGEMVLHNASGDGLEQAGTLTAESRATLAQLELVRPAHAGKVGAGAWNEYLYKPVLAAATGTIIQQRPIPKIVQREREITAYEEEWLAYAERNQPVATEGLGYALWWETVKAQVSAAAESVGASADQKALDDAFLARLAATHPAGDFDEDGAVFQTEVTAKLGAAIELATGELANKWTTRAALQPSGGGAKSYAAWAAAYADVAQSYHPAIGTVPEYKKAAFQLLIDLRPCAAGPEVDAVVERLVAGLASAGNGPDDVTSLAELSRPVACDSGEPTPTSPNP